MFVERLVAASILFLKFIELHQHFMDSHRNCQQNIIEIHDICLCYLFTEPLNFMIQPGGSWADRPGSNWWYIEVSWILGYLKICQLKQQILQLIISIIFYCLLDVI